MQGGTGGLAKTYNGTPGNRPPLPKAPLQNSTNGPAGNKPGMPSGPKKVGGPKPSGQPGGSPQHKPLQLPTPLAPTQLVMNTEPAAPNRLKNDVKNPSHQVDNRRKTVKKPIAPMDVAGTDKNWWEERKSNYFEYANEDGDIIEPDGTIAIALWDFRGERPTDLSFNKGDSILVIQRYDNGWWEGELNGVIGDFPCNFVEVEDEEDEPSPTNEGTKNTSTPAPSQIITPAPNAPAGSVPIIPRPTNPLSDSQNANNSVSHYAKGLPIKEGFLTKKGHKRRNWKVRYFVLEQKKLSYFKTPSDFLAARKAKGIVVLQKSTLVRIAPEMKRSNCFSISCAENQLYITAPTGQEMVSWMEEISTTRDS